MKVNKVVKDITVRELYILVACVVVGFALESLYVFFKGPNVGPPIHFWRDPYAYQIWKNSLRENGEIIKILGYPISVILRLNFYIINVLRQQSQVSFGEYAPEEVRALMQDIAREVKLAKRIEGVSYRKEHQWYIVRFDIPPNCIVPKRLIDECAKAEGRSARKKIGDILLSSM